ncbi:hypothetical protein MMC29_007763, partial [Sticta canariensis]|nr:hypothetical protein [Sticta canariensis]
MCEIVILESKRSRRYSKTPFGESPPPQTTMILRVVPVSEEKGRRAAAKGPVVYPLAAKSSAVKAPVVNPPAVKSSAVKLPVKLPVVYRPATKSPDVQTPPPSNDDGQPSANNGYKKDHSPVTTPEDSSESEPSPPEKIRRVRVTPEPNKVRVPKIVRFAFDETRNTAMEEIDAKVLRRRALHPTSSSDSSDSSDSSIQSFTDSPTAISPQTFGPCLGQTTSGPSSQETSRARNSERSSSSTKDDRSFRSKEWNAFQAGDNMSRNSSGKMKADMYLPDTDSDEWDLESDVESNIDPGDCIVDPDDDGWKSNNYRSSRLGKGAEPIFVMRSRDKRSSSASAPTVSSSSIPKKRLEPVFICRSKGDLPSKDPLFVWRPSSDIDKECRVMYEKRPAAVDDFHTITNKQNVAPSPQLQQHQQPATDQTNATTSRSRAVRDSWMDHHRHKSTHRSSHNRSRNPPSIIHEEDEEEIPRRQYHTNSRYSWRD